MSDVLAEHIKVDNWFFVLNQKVWLKHTGFSECGNFVIGRQIGSNREWRIPLDEPVEAQSTKAVAKRGAVK